MTARGEMTVGEFFDRWADLSVGRTAETEKHNRAMVRPFVVAYERLPLGEMVPVDAQEWAKGRPGQVRYLRLFFADAVRLGLCDSNPFAGVRGGQTRTMDRTPPDLATLARIMAEARPCFRDVIVVAAYTGLRCSELAMVEARDVVEVPALRIVVRCGKGGRTGDHAPVLGPAEDVVRDLAARREGRLFSSEGDRQWSRFSVAGAWKAACAPIGFESTFHSLRRFFATWLLNRGASYQDVAVALRHFDKHGRPNIELVARIYGHPDPSTALGRLEAMA